MVLSGKARVKLRKVGSTNVEEFILDGNKPCFIDIPVWYVHNITNIGSKILITSFWINEEFNKDDPDTYYEKV